MLFKFIPLYFYVYADFVTLYDFAMTQLQYIN